MSSSLKYHPSLCEKCGSYEFVLEELNFEDSKLLIVTYCKKCKHIKETKVRNSLYKTDDAVEKLKMDGYMTISEYMNYCTNKELSRFSLQKSKYKPEHWVCTDTENGIVCIFENHKYINTRKFTFLDNVKVNKQTSLDLAKIVLEISHFLEKNHNEKII